MSAIFILKKKRATKKHKFYIFLKDHYFLMFSSIDMNVGVFWETSVGFLKSAVLQLSQNIAKVMTIRMSKVGQNSTALKK